MRRLTYVGGSTIEWWDVPAPRLQDGRDALVRPLAVTRCDLDLTIVGGKSGLPGPFALGHETAGIVTDVGKVRFEDAHEAIGDPTIRVAFVGDGIDWHKTLGSPSQDTAFDQAA